MLVINYNYPQGKQFYLFLFYGYFVKILFIASLEVDGLEDIIYSGLNKIPNVELYEFRNKPSYHNVSDTLSANLNPIIKPKWIEQRISKRNVLETIDEIDFNSFDIVVIGSIRKDVVGYIPFILKKAFGRIIFLDGEDDPFIRLLLLRTTIYFKREKFNSLRSSIAAVNKWNVRSALSEAKYSFQESLSAMILPQFPKMSNKIKPLNLSVLPHKVQERQDLDIDVSFVGRISSQIRVKYINVLKSIADRNSLNLYVNTNGLSPDRYQEIMLRSKICVSLPGSGYDTFRYWEIPYYSRCLLSFKVPISIPNNFEDEYSALYFTDKYSLEDKILYAIKKDNYEDIRKMGKQDFERNHTDIQRARNVINNMEI